MSNKKARVKKELELIFENKIIKENDEGFKINIQSIDDTHIGVLNTVGIILACDVQVKRSGAGLVVLIQI